MADPAISVQASPYRVNVQSLFADCRVSDLTLTALQSDQSPVSLSYQIFGCPFYFFYFINWMSPLFPNKNCVGTASGGPWTPRYQSFFDGADLNINKAIENLVTVPNHRGPHPAAYHQYVYDRLDGATTGIKANAPEYKRAVTNTLNQIKQEAVTSGSRVNDWLTGK